MSGLTTELAVAHSVRDIATMLDWVHGPALGDPTAARSRPGPTGRGNRRYRAAQDPLLTESLTGDTPSRPWSTRQTACGARDPRP